MCILCVRQCPYRPSWTLYVLAIEYRIASYGDTRSSLRRAGRVPVRRLILTRIYVSTTVHVL